MVMSGNGRPKSSCVLQYDKQADKSVCIMLFSTSQIENCQDCTSSSLCGIGFKGQFPTNLKRYLKICHYEQYTTFEAVEKERKKRKQTKPNLILLLQ